MTSNRQDEAAFTARRRRRNLAIGLTLAAFALLFYGITISKMVV
jgi:hypothetical protein